MAYQTCEELKSSPFNTTGTYSIDPDGSGKPVELYCDMEKGFTEVGHNMEGIHDVSYCKGDGCYSLSLEYNVPLDQVEALISMSGHCEQEIMFQCKMAPLKSSGLFSNVNVNYGWWTDRLGENKFYFDGDDETQHVCGCHSSNSCSHSSFNSTCNCDLSLVPLWNADNGKITNKDSLPIKSFHYGGFFNSHQAAKITIGKLRCSGKSKSPTETISTCSTLKKSGLATPGFYLTKDTPSDPLSVNYCSLSSPGYSEDMLRVGKDMLLLPKVQEFEILDYKCTSSQCRNRYNNWYTISELSLNHTSSTDFVIDAAEGSLMFKETGFYIYSTKASSGWFRTYLGSNSCTGTCQFHMTAGEKITFKMDGSQYNNKRTFGKFYVKHL